MTRRASLPSVDELFGGPRAHEPRPAPTGSASHEDVDSPGVSPGPEEASAAWGTVRALVAAEDAATSAARRAAADHGPPSPEVCALLRWALAAGDARAVLEIGSAGGVSGRWILDTLPSGGVLTSLEPDGEAHEIAGKALGGTPSGPRVRAIHGDVATLLSRLADGAYDLVLLQADPGAYPQHLERIRDLLRVGGTLVVRHTTPVGEHEAELLRFAQQLTEDPAFHATMLSVDGGVALASRVGDA